MKCDETGDENTLAYHTRVYASYGWCAHKRQSRHKDTETTHTHTHTHHTLTAVELNNECVKVSSTQHWPKCCRHTGMPRVSCSVSLFTKQFRRKCCNRANTVEYGMQDVIYMSGYRVRNVWRSFCLHRTLAQRRVLSSRVVGRVYRLSTYRMTMQGVLVEKLHNNQSTVVDTREIIRNMSGSRVASNMVINLVVIAPIAPFAYSCYVLVS